MPRMQIDLTEEENKKVEMFKIKLRCKTKAEAVKGMVGGVSFTVLVPHIPKGGSLSGGGGERCRN